MSGWLRRIRAAIGMGLTWGAAWFGAGIALLLVVGPGAADVPFPIGFGVLGFLAGATFSGVLAAGGKTRRFEQLSLPRFAGWGALGGLLFAAAFAAVTGLGSELLVVAPVFALAGAGSAAGTLALARKAREPQRLDAGADGSENRSE